MKPVTIYTTPFCGFCHAAKRLLTAKGVQFSEFDVSRDPAKRQEMLSKSNGSRTVPQIFIDGTHVGGFDDINALDRSGKLDPILAA
jgi:glutaredoxin 3